MKEELVKDITAMAMAAEVTFYNKLQTPLKELYDKDQLDLEVTCKENSMYPNLRLSKGSIVVRYGVFNSIHLMTHCGVGEEPDDPTLLVEYDVNETGFMTGKKIGMEVAKALSTLNKNGELKIDV